MAMKFHGARSELKRLLADAGIAGSWEAKPNGVFMMRAPDGANLHWASGSKSLWIDGKPDAKPTLTALVARLLHGLDDDG